MSNKKNSLGSEIAQAISERIGTDRKLSKKAIARIEKTATKLTEKLHELFAKEDKAAQSKTLKEKGT
jgi:exonuclease I